MVNPENLDTQPILKPWIPIDIESALHIHENNSLEYIKNYEIEKEKKLELVSHVDRNNKAYEKFFNDFLLESA